MIINENDKKAINMSIEEFAEKVKETLGFETYKRAVLKGEEKTAVILQMTSMLHGMMDKEFDLAMMSVAHNLLFGMLDQRFRNEILSENKTEVSD